MRRLVLCLSLSCLVLALGACRSAPTHFYTLLPPASASEVRGHAAYDIAVLPVTIPAQVDRPQMVVRDGDGSVALLQGQRWIGPLGDEIRSAVSIGLMRRLGAKDVYGLPHDSDTPVYRVNVNVRRFESAPGQYTYLLAAWSVHADKSGNDPTIACTSDIRESVGAGYAALARGHQTALYALAGDIATVIQAAAGGDAMHCPGRH
ncbi:MAG TPA: PqiC family protein [Oleiagrimonas sp.]|nr:PqiC family protein [Oleiagrimonas sp.]